jgi:hypothetical protein
MANTITKVEQAITRTANKSVIPAKQQRALAQVVLHYESLKGEYEMAKARYDTGRAELLGVLEAHQLDSFAIELPDLPKITVTKVAPSKREKVDTQKLKLVYPDIAEELTSYTEVDPYVRLKIQYKEPVSEVA